MVREKVSGPESRKVCDDGGEKSTRMWLWGWWVQKVDGKEVKKEKGKSSCGEEAEKVVSQEKRNVVLDVRCVVEPEKSGDDECGRGDVE